MIEPTRKEGSAIEAEQRTAQRFRETLSRDGQMSIAWLLAVLLRQRRLIAGVTASVLGVVLMISLTRPSTYTTTFSFVPEVPQDAGRSGLAGLAGQLGVTFGSAGGQTQSPQFYADLLKTHQVLAPIAKDTVAVGREGSQRMKLSEFLGVSGSNPAIVLDRTVQILSTRVISSSVATRTTGVVSVRVRSRSPHVSLSIAERVLSGLSQFNLMVRQSQAAAEREFVEQRLDAARASLRAAENALQSFLQGNRQVGNAPELSFQRDRLQREVALRQQVVMGLAQQYEDARIREVRDTPVITVIERPTLRVVPDPQGRLVTTLLATVVGFFLGAMLALVREGWNRQRVEDGPDPSYELLASEWQRVRRKIRRS